MAASRLLEFALNNDLTSLDHIFSGSSVSFNYSHNKVHQLTSVSVNDNSYLWMPTAPSSVSYGTANDLNQYPSVGGTSYSYNNSGCTTAGPLTSAQFDMLNRLTQAVAGSNTNNYLIDPLDRQAQKNASGTKTDFLYDGNQLIATLDDSTGAIVNRFIPGDNLDEIFLYINGSTTTYLHRDRQGTVIAESNSSGAVVNKYTYSPFGETTSISASGFGYTGQLYDSEVGLYNYRARYYAPSIGRFLQPDPLGYDAGDMNLVRLCRQ